MVEEYEVVVLILGLVALTVVLLNRQRLKNLPGREIFLASFLLFLVSWVFTNLEAFLWGNIFNLMEHISQAFGGILVAAWSWRVFGNKEKRQ